MSGLGLWLLEQIDAEHKAKRAFVEREITRRVTQGLLDVCARLGVPGAIEFGPGGEWIQIGEERMTSAEYDKRFSKPAPPSDALRMFAQVYAERPGWREEWTRC
jgi:hypothetical protein